MKNMTAKEVLRRAYVDLPALCQNMKNMDEVRRELEGISLRAGEMAAYIDERHGYGCGDQGHDKALKRMNKVGRTIWMKAFGYNAFHDLSF